MKRFGFLGVLFAAMTVVMWGCASRDDTVTEESSSQSAAPVPGEKVPGEGGVSAGAAPGAASAGVRW